jgi:beta-glucanase (GH16 family)
MMKAKALTQVALLLSLVTLFVWPARTANAASAVPERTLFDRESVVWAVNVGGGEHRSDDGIHYASDEAVSGGVKGAVDSVDGVQDQGVYLSYRIGQLQVKKSLPNGAYDLTFHFTEPAEARPGERLFDVVVVGEKRIVNLDISRARGGSVSPSGLLRTVPGVLVTDGVLDIRLASSQSDAVLSALVVRERRPSPAEWELVWSDEFESEGRPDPARWSAERWAPHKVNREAQAYTDHERNLRVEGGSLVIEAHRDPDGRDGYTSARIHSRGKGDFLYGRVDIRARLPSGQGTWAALWMLPSDPFRYTSSCDKGDEWHGNRECDAWPNSGEIDIMEHVGYEMSVVHATVHNRHTHGGGPRQVSGTIEASGLEERFHVYSLEWSPQRIDIYLDGTIYYTYLNEGNGWKQWPFDHPFHVIMNLAIGGDWGEAGGPIDDGIFPTAMEVDYVRVFRSAEVERTTE